MSSFTLVTGGYDNTIRFFDATNQTLIHTVQFCDQQVLRLAFSSDSPVSHDDPLFLIAGGSPTVAVYDVTHFDNSPTIFQVHQGHTEAITAVGFEPKHTAFVFSASEDGTLQTWFPQLAPHQPLPHPYPHMQHQIVHPMAAGAYLPNGRMRCEHVPATMRNLGPFGSVAIHDAIYFPPSDYFFTVDALGRFRVWNHLDSSIKCTVIPHRSKRNLQCIDISSDFATVVMANFDGFVFIYGVEHVLSDATTAVPITFRAHERYIPRVRLSVSAAILVCTTCSGPIRLFRMADIMAHSSTASTLSNDSDVHHPDIDAVAPFRDFTGHRGWIWDAAFVEDRDDYLFTCSSNMQVMLWYLNDLQNSTEYQGHEKGVVCLAVRERMSPTVPPDQFGLPPPEYLATSPLEEDMVANQYPDVNT